MSPPLFSAVFRSSTTKSDVGTAARTTGNSSKRQEEEEREEEEREGTKLKLVEISRN
jgi:hypothetical protein